jgi:hypothetical protein
LYVIAFLLNDRCANPLLELEGRHALAAIAQPRDQIEFGSACRPGINHIFDAAV